LAKQSSPRIFLCHASEDKPLVEKLYRQLKKAEYSPWLDKYDLLPGQDWWTEIKKVITNPYNLVVVCLSGRSVTKRGTFQKEIKHILDMLEEMPEDTIYLIPARLEPSKVPDRLSHLHWVDVFEEDGFQYLKGALDFELDKRQAPDEPEMVLVPAGKFLMGFKPEHFLERLLGIFFERWNYLRLHTQYLPDYYIAKTPITNAQYAAFVQATGHERPRHWRWTNTAEKQDHPVVEVSWHDAVAYCKWLSEVTGKPYRLPSEPEWEKAARGTDGRIYPWGNRWEWDKERCNTREGANGGTTPVGAYPNGASPYGCLDMAGNVWERTLSIYKDYPYDPTDGRENLEASDKGLRVLRGGSWVDPRSSARCAFRYRVYPVFRLFNFGFRVVVSPISSSAR